VLRAAPGHHRIDGDVPRRRLQVGRLENGDRFVRRAIGEFEESLDALDSRRDDRQAVAPFLLVEVPADFRRRARENDVLWIARGACRSRLAAAASQSGDDLADEV
jgi:hypothetical protein